MPPEGNEEAKRTNEIKTVIPLDGVERGHGVMLPFNPVFLEDRQGQGDRQQDHAERPRHGRVASELADELVVGLDGEHPEVFADEDGHAEVFDAEIEDDQRHQARHQGFADDAGRLTHPNRP